MEGADCAESEGEEQARPCSPPLRLRPPPSPAHPSRRGRDAQTVLLVDEESGVVTPMWRPT
eukprot:7123612-Prymnesium_polylepis.2